ncbi:MULTISPECIES: hypothetical protein [unclassified Rhizobium]|uniref:hypothetical protein n=1 Tax=Rhizobium TaxID=379 RepID=UPI00084BC59A|nr:MULTISPECIES: hypothetical protein [unclassified Rhizobium]OEC99457.1 hypothetical protein A9Z06_18955 [Rhizobium sp. YK2]QYA14424.1 hypothetical protein J5284_09595 [Rhizobium sp. AB2/73]UEQ79643.1 hypothetical protein I8E17_12405 [Rhizobium sp. AB2/73]
MLYFGNLQKAMDLSPLVGDLICTVHSPPGKWSPFDETTPVICAQAFLASALGTSMVAMTAYLRLETWHGAVNKPVLSIILQTRNALLTASSAAIAELAITSMVAAAKNNLIENPDPLWRHGARACFVLQEMLHGFPLAV